MSQLFPSSPQASLLPCLFDLSEIEHKALFADLIYPWELVARIEFYLLQLLSGPFKPGIHSPVPASATIGPNVYLGPDCSVEPGVYIKGPAWIGRGCTLRQGLYCKENVIAEAGSFLGHASELKNCYLMPKAEVPHFNYVGDSILGTRAHLGAGVILSNVRLDKRTIAIRLGDERIDTGLEKLGAIIGDGCEIGCNSVLNPGSILGRKSALYPLSYWNGILEENGRVAR
ncbi:glucose-1-phosphate thymidylyltransferase [Treponema sp.]